MNLRELSALPLQTMLTRQDLAAFLERDEETVSRAVERGELPPPTKICNSNIWMVEGILAHVRQRLENESAKRANVLRLRQERKP